MQKIAIVCKNWTPNRCDAVRGVFDFASTTKDWDVEIYTDFGNGRAERMRNDRTQGVLLWPEDLPAQQVEIFNDMGLPVICVGSSVGDHPAVMVDPESVARLCQEHVKEHDFESLIYLASDTASEVAKYFEKWNESKFHIQPLPRLENALCVSQDNLEALLHRLKAKGQSHVIIADNDHAAVFIYRSAIRIGLPVPEKLSVLSTMDGFGCRLPVSPITSVEIPWHEIGFQAARWMHKLLSGNLPPTEPILVECEALNRRASSPSCDMNPAIARAIRFIHENADRAINVSSLMAHQTVSRVTFERQFREAVGCSPGEKIREIRLEKAKQFLIDSLEPITEIGRRLGFDTPTKFSSFFRKGTGETPSQFRQRVRKVAQQS